MDPHTNSQKLNSGDLTISRANFHLALCEDKENPSTVHRANKSIEVQNRISTGDTSNMDSSKSRAQGLKSLLEDLKKLREEAEESFRKSLPKKQKSIRNLKKAEEEEEYSLSNYIITVTTPNRGKSELLESILGIPKGAALIGCLLPSPVATVVLPLTIGAIEQSGSTAFCLSATLLRIKIKNCRDARNKVINPFDEKSRRQDPKQFIFQTAILILVLIGMYFTESEETRAKKTKTSSSYHSQCGCHCSSFQHRCYTTSCPHSVSA